MKKIISLLLVITSFLLVLTSCAAADKSGAANAPNNYYPQYYPQKRTTTANLSVEDESLETAPDASEPVYGYYDEDYGKFIENEFINTIDAPVSTFSADVDTASYAYFRKLVNEGYNLTTLNSIAGSSVRTEEMINYFK